MCQEIVLYYNITISKYISNTNSHPPDFDGDAYNVWGVTSSEVELDVLTGEHVIRRVDLVEDAGIRFE